MSIEHHLPLIMNETQMSGERAQCGLTSLLPMSCRGRAEEFARTLQRRLRTLGGAGDDAETHWIGAAPSSRRDSDLFHCELECESPSSPVDEYDAPSRDRASPDDDAPFYDVEEPEPRFRRTDAGRVNGDAAAPRANGLAFAPAFLADRSPIKTQPTPRENGHSDGRLFAAITFDGCERQDSRDRLLDQTDSAALRLCPPRQLSTQLTTDSDSEFESAKSDLTDVADEIVGSEERQKLEDDSCSLASDRLSELSLLLEDESTETNRAEIDSSPSVIENNYDRMQEITSETIEECAIAFDIKTEDIVRENGSIDAAEQEPDTLETKTEIEEDDRPQRIRRCSSLKTGKTPPGTPGHKKIVRFADVLGLDLADVKTFMDDIPYIPKEAFADLRGADVAIGSPPTTARLPPTQRSNGYGGSLRLVPLFQTTRDINESLEARCVCLESARVADGPNVNVCGSVRVRNLDFHKTVHVRYTMDNWRTYTDVQATYVPGSCDGFSDRFTFLLCAPAISAGQRLEIAVRFQCKGCQYWDNNFGINYCFDCLPLGVPSVVCINSSPLHPTRDWHPSFY